MGETLPRSRGNKVPNKSLLCFVKGSNCCEIEFNRLTNPLLGVLELERVLVGGHLKEPPFFADLTQ